MTKRICIIGMAKSGTSALYSSIKAELPEPRRLMFEPSSLGELRFVTNDPACNGLTKMIFTSFGKYDYQPARFTHNVAIVRDPRDVMVSTIMFQFNRLKVLNDKDLLNRLVGLFERKERDPRSISIVELMDARGEGEAAKFRDSLAKQLARYGAYLDRGTHHVVMFDQMIAGEFAALNAYLGLDVRKPDRLQGWVSKISRKGDSGDWKHWFCPSDVAYFRSHIDPFLTKYGLTTDWALADPPHIDPEYCSRYIRRLAQARIEDPNRSSPTTVDEASLWSAIEDGKVNAIQRLITLYQARRGKEDAIAALNERLGQFGHGEAAVLAAAHFLRHRDEARALAAYREGIAVDHPPALLGLARDFARSPDPALRAEAEEAGRRHAALGGH